MVAYFRRFNNLGLGCVLMGGGGKGDICSPQDLKKKKRMDGEKDNQPKFWPFLQSPKFVFPPPLPSRNKKKIFSFQTNIYLYYAPFPPLYFFDEYFFNSVNK